MISFVGYEGEAYGTEIVTMGPASNHDCSCRMMDGKNIETSALLTTVLSIYSELAPACTNVMSLTAEISSSIST
jgi:hypothetical protein